MRLAQAHLVQAIKAEAHRLGFPLVGITSPDASPCQGVYERHADVYERQISVYERQISVYERWLQAGHHGEMAYLASDRARACRADPRQILPECESILVLGLPYPASTAEAFAWSPQPGIGQVASYAWGLDYHDIIPPRLQTLVEFIQAQVGRSIPNRYYTDTGPLLERYLAQGAGLGWIGKNTCLINPRHGSYFFLAEILLGLALPLDEPFAVDRCGSCTRCLDACPTACILPDRTLDARRCISYLTIENKGPIPAELQPALGNWVFGCDICQQVCPWNRFASPSGDAALAPRPEQARPNLLAELQLTPEAFNRKFRRTPIKRAKRRGYVRNVVAALRNARLAGVEDSLQRLKDDPDLGVLIAMEK